VSFVGHVTLSIVINVSVSKMVHVTVSFVVHVTLSIVINVSVITMVHVTVSIMVHVTASIVVHVTQLLFAGESFLLNNDYYLKMNDFLYIYTNTCMVTNGPCSSDFRSDQKHKKLLNNKPRLKSFLR